jgi:hypothetical protein
MGKFSDDSRNDFRREVISRLRGLPTQKLVAFIARTTGCALANFGDSDNSTFLNFWAQKDQEKPLFIILHSVLSAYGMALDIRINSLSSDDLDKATKTIPANYKKAISAAQSLYPILLLPSHS